MAAHRGPGVLAEGIRALRPLPEPAEGCGRRWSLLHKRGLKHLRARKHGSAVIVESGPAEDPIRHVRLRRDTVHLWWLDFADHRGRWERTQYRATLDELIAQVIDAFPWIVSDRENPERT